MLSAPSSYRNEAFVITGKNQLKNLFCIKTRVCLKYKRLLQKITSNHYCDHFCKGWFYLSAKEKNPSHMKIYTNIMIIVAWYYLRRVSISCNTINIKKNLKIPFIKYADMESLLEKLHVCHNNPDKSSIKKNKHTTCGYSLFKNCSFDSSKNKHNF